MEIQQALPNYLDQECWEGLKGNPLRGTIIDPFDVDSMMPNRPVWVRAHEIINRDALLEKFCGLLTYGSPLERFCALWSAMIPINKTEDPFHAGTEWINVYDPTDPVGTWLEDFNPYHTPPPRNGRTALKPYNFPCRASRWLLISHISYLNAARRETDDSKHYLVNVVAKWLVEGGSLAEKIDQAHKGNKTFWMQHGENEHQTRRYVVVRRNWRVIQAAIVGLILTLLALLSLEYVVLPLIKTTTGVLSPFVKNLLGGLKLSILIPWISAFLTFFKKGLSTISYCLSEAWSSLADHFHLWPWIPKFVIEAIVLWTAMFCVVIGACLIHYRASKNDRDRLHARFTPQTK